jgi:glycosyltransferase involved in cell wall biosynthesis
VEHRTEFAADGGAPDWTSITAVIPMHNASGTILRALASVTAQTLAVQRIIVVDGASTDGSVEIVEHCGLPNLQIIREPSKRGPGAGRNTGVAAATTSWVALLDADDSWAPTFLAEVTSAISVFGADFGSAGGSRTKEYRGSGRQTVSRRLLSTPQTYVDLTDDFWRVALRFPPTHTSSTLIRKSLYEAAGGCPEDMRYGEDMILFIGLWLHGRFAFVNKPLFESIAIASGLSAGPLRYRDVRLGLQRMVSALVTSVRLRKRGTGWFALFVLERTARRNIAWAVRKLQLRRLLTQIR